MTLLFHKVVIHEKQMCQFRGPKRKLICHLYLYLLQEGLIVSKDLRVHQSFEDLEAMFEAGEKFRFEAVIQLQETK